MKRTISVILVLALSLCTGIIAFAADIDTDGGSTSKDVKGTYVPRDTPIVYSVDVTWGSMEFTYTGAFEGKWNPNTHTYEESDPAYWSCEEGDNIITVINHSNTAITVAFNYTPGTSYAGITGSFSPSAINLQTAEESLPANAPSGSSELTLSGSLNESVVTPTVIGSVTVTISN